MNNSNVLNNSKKMFDDMNSQMKEYLKKSNEIKSKDNLSYSFKDHINRSFKENNTEIYNNEVIKTNDIPVREDKTNISINEKELNLVIERQSQIINDLTTKIKILEENQKKLNPNLIEFNELEKNLYNKLENQKSKWEEIKPICLQKRNKNKQTDKWNNFKEHMENLWKVKNKNNKKIKNKTKKI